MRAITSRKEAGHARRRHVPEPARPLRPRLQRPADADLDGCDVVFFATPHGVAMAQARELLGAGAQIIDLAADFRLQGSGAVRALVQDAARVPRPARARRCTACRRSTARRSARRASSATPAAIRPLCSSASCRCSRRAWSIRAPDRRLQVRRVRRGPQGRVSACCSPKRRTISRPTPSSGIATCPRSSRGSNGAQREPVRLVFTPHLTPMIRGIHATLYAPLTKTDVDLQALLREALRRRAVRRRDAAGSLPGHAQRPRVEHAAASPSTARATATLALVLAVEDNLVKGAAGPGDAEHEPDVRAARDHRPHGAAGIAVAQLTLARGLPKPRRDPC